MHQHSTRPGQVNNTTTTAIQPLTTPIRTRRQYGGEDNSCGVLLCSWAWSSAVWRTTVWPTRWTLFPFRPVHAWLVWCWPACVWSVYGQVAAAAAEWLVRGCLGRLMVGLVCVDSVALLPVVVSPNVVCAAGTSVCVLVSCVLV